LWPSLSAPLSGILANRAAARRRSLAALIEERCTEEVAAMQEILDELERSIRDALDDTPFWEQASLFEIEAERDQLRKDKDALVQRLDSIPAVREQEIAALRRRYADPQARVVPGGNHLPGASVLRERVRGKCGRCVMALRKESGRPPGRGRSH
jgi:hypothetical protein